MFLLRAQAILAEVFFQAARLRVEEAIGAVRCAAAKHGFFSF
jgi:hypothetical protein